MTFLVIEEKCYSPKTAPRLPVWCLKWQVLTWVGVVSLDSVGLVSTKNTVSITSHSVQKEKKKKMRTPEKKETWTFSILHVQTITKQEGRRFDFSLVFFCVLVACFPCVCFGSFLDLRLTPTVRKNMQVRSIDVNSDSKSMMGKLQVAGNVRPNCFYIPAHQWLRELPKSRQDFQCIELVL